jgi:hypothetical protein
MPGIEDWARQNKTPLIIGGLALGGIVIYSLSKRGSATTASSNQVTLSTLHDDLTSIDKRLSEENSYLSSSASYSPLDAFTSGNSGTTYENQNYHPTITETNTSNTSSSGASVAPGSKTTGTTTGTQVIPTHSGGTTFGGTKPPGVFGPIHGNVGTGPGDFEPVFAGLQFGYGGDSSDYAGLN